MCFVPVGSRNHDLRERHVPLRVVAGRKNGLGRTLC